MPSEAEVFISHLNASRQSSTAGSHASNGQGPNQIHYLQERIAAVRHENRDLRVELARVHSELEKFRAESQRLGAELAELGHNNHLLWTEFQRVERLAQFCQEQSRVRGKDLDDIRASWNWRLANRLHKARSLRPVLAVLLPGAPGRGKTY
jgi:hypothetical protein